VSEGSASGAPDERPSADAAPPVTAAGDRAAADEDGPVGVGDGGEDAGGYEGSAGTSAAAERRLPRGDDGVDADGPRRWFRRRDRGVAVLAAAGVVLVLAAGGIGVRAAAGTGDRGEPPVTGAEPTASAEAPSDAARSTAVAGVATSRPDGSWGPVSGQSPVAAPTGRAAAGIRPLGVRIPAIGVDATSLVPLAIIPATGELAAPAEFDQTGWYAAGPVPGEPGPAVIAAHVDSRRGPAVFFRLKELRPGDKVYVPRSDGSTATFTVTGVERYPKNVFPTQKVHGPTPDRALRLITCGGSFDYAKRSYRDNIVVYAVRTR
jgi:hypothetical protein